MPAKKKTTPKTRLAEKKKTTAKRATPRKKGVDATSEEALRALSLESRAP